MLVLVGCWAFIVGTSRMLNFNANASGMLDYRRK